MLYLLTIFLYLLAGSFIYLFVGAMYVFVVNMLVDGHDWEHSIWILWPYFALERYRLHQFTRYLERKWME